MQQTINVYTFDQLNDGIKQKVIDKNRDVLLCDNWHEYTTDYYITVAKSLGFSDVSFEFRLAYSQGDGAAIIADFDSKSVDKNEALKHISENDYNLLTFFNVSASVKNDSSMYCHNMTSSVELSDNFTDIVDELTFRGPESEYVIEIFQRIDEIVIKLARSICNDLMISLDNELSHLTDDDTIAEYLTEDDHTLYTIQGVQV